MMEAKLSDLFRAVNDNNVDNALDCCSDEIQVSYPDPGRNWQGKQRGMLKCTQRE